MESKFVRVNDINEETNEEDNVDICELTRQLRILLTNTYPDLRLPPDGDKILERCIRHRKFNINEAAHQVHSFFTVFRDLSRMKSENILLPSVHKGYFLDSLSIGILKQRDSRGTPILYGTYETMHGETFCGAKALALFILLLHEMSQLSTDLQTTGMLTLVNLKGFQFAHAKQFSFSRLRALAKLIQGAVPVRIKGLHCINAPSIFYYSYAMIKPFLRQKIRDRIHLHGNDLTEFYKVVDKSLLPIALDGELPTEEAVDNDFVTDFCKKDEYYTEFLRYGYFTTPHMS